MKISESIETLKMAFDSLKTNKMRSLLSSLGVVIGISFVILMGWVISGLDTAMQDTFNILGTDMLYVDKWDWSGGKSWKEVRQRKEITVQQAEEFCKRIQTAELAIPIAEQWNAQIKYKNETYEGIIINGTTSDHARTPAGKILIGRHLTPFEDQSSANVAVLGYKVYTTLFPKGGAIGETIKINGFKFTIIGVIKKQGTMMLDFVDNQIYMPFTTFLGAYGKLRRSISIAVKAGGEQQLDEVRAETQGLMRNIRNNKPGQDDDFSINETKAFESSVKTLRLYVWGIGIGMTVLSFIVGIIGIMNIMFVSVTERTREIGIRKAVGAKKSSIWLQFIMESSALCLVGAFLSFILCSVFVFAVATILPRFVPSMAFLSPVMPFELLMIASLVSIFVGVLSGLIPAIRAANLDPVDALRYE